MQKKVMENVQEKLFKEMSEGIETSFKSLIENRKKSEGRLSKMEEARDLKKQRLADLRQSSPRILEQFKTAKPEELADISRRRVELAKETVEIEELLSDLEMHVFPQLGKDLTEAVEALRQNVGEFIFSRRDLYNEELSLLVNETIEPKLVAWQETVLAISTIYQLGFNFNQAMRRVGFYNPLIFEACDNREEKLMQLWQKDHPEPVTEVAGVSVKPTDLAQKKESPLSWTEGSQHVRNQFSTRVNW
jgi:hypothetical protein